MASKKEIDIKINVDSSKAVDGLEDVDEATEDVTEGMEGAAVASTAFGGTLGVLQGAMTKLKAGFAVVRAGFFSMKTAIAATGIGLLLIAFASLTAFFTKSKRGAELLERATAGVGAVFGVLSDQLVKAGEFLVKVFSEPKQLIKDLGNLIVENITNRIKAFGVAGKAIVKIFKGDFVEGFKELGNATLQFSTGVEDVIGKVQGAAEATATFFDEVATSASNAANAAFELTRRQQVLNDQMRDFRTVQASILNQINALKIGSTDLTKSEEDRIALLEEAARIEQKFTKQRIKFAEEQVAIIQAQNALSESTAEDLDRLADAEVELAVARSKSLKIATDLSVKEAIIRKQAEDKRIAMVQEAEKILIDILEEGTEKKIALIQFEKDKKLALIVEGGAEEIALRQAIELEAQTKITTAQKEGEKARTDSDAAFKQKKFDTNLQDAQKTTDLALQVTQGLIDISNTLSAFETQNNEARVKNIDATATKEINTARNTAQQRGFTVQQLAAFEKGVLAKADKDKDKIAEREFERQKKLQFVQAVIAANAASLSTFLSMIQSTGNFYVAGGFASGVLTQGLLTANLIRRQKFTGSGSVSLGSSPNFNIGASTTSSNIATPNVGGGFDTGGQVDVPTGLQTSLTPVGGSETETISGGGAGSLQTVQAWVSERDITTTQNNIADLEQRAEIGG